MVNNTRIMTRKMNQPIKVVFTGYIRSYKAGKKSFVLGVDLGYFLKGLLCTIATL